MLHQLLGRHSQTLGGKLGVQEREEKLPAFAAGLLWALICPFVWPFSRALPWARRAFCGVSRISLQVLAQEQCSLVEPGALAFDVVQRVLDCLRQLSVDPRPPRQGHAGARGT